MAKRKKSGGFKKFLLFIIFLAIGCGGGYYIAKEYLLKEDSDIPIATELGPKDITNSSEFGDTINSLYSFLQKNVYLYDSKGANSNSISNEIKLNLAFDYVINNKMSTIPNNWYGSINCDYNFLIDTVDNEDGTATNMDYCKVYIITKDSLNNAIKNTFRDTSVDMIDDYSPKNGYSCHIQEDGTYMCGKVVNSNLSSGEIVSKFEIVKVTLDDDNTITIYDKGYLQDTRSNIVTNPNYSNYYLHSYDSTEYYYELKSKDNLTFKHVFVLDDNGKYYYVNSEVVK